MRARYLVAAGFVVVVSALLLIRHAGYLGGRAAGGPLELGLRGNGAGGSARPGETLGVGMDVGLEGDGGVRVASVEPNFASAGLDLRGPRIDPTGQCGGCDFPRSERPVIGRTLTRTDRGAVIGLRARRPGVYYAFGLTVDYRRGSRRFRYRDDQTGCLAVGRRNRCSLDYVLPTNAKVAEAGGPSDFGTSIREGDPNERPMQATYPVAAATRTPAFTLTNLTGHEVSVRDVAIAQVEGDGYRIVPGRAKPSAFTLARHDSRRVRLPIEVTGCLRKSAAVEPSVRATIDGDRTEIPMSVALVFRGRGCT